MNVCFDVDEDQKIAPPVLRGTSPASSQGKSAEEISGITAKDYQQAKLCAILLPISMLVGSAIGLILLVNEADHPSGSTPYLWKGILLLTVLVGGYLATRATKLKLKPYRDFKREVDLAAYRRKNNSE